MNTTTPLIREGITPFRGKSSFFFKVMLVLSVHLVVIGVMLLQGCKNTNTDSAARDTTMAGDDASNLPPASGEGASNPAVNAPQNRIQPAPQQPQLKQAPLQPLQSATVTSVAASAVPMAKEYVIVSGDTLRGIARKSGVALKSLMDANPGINPMKLQAGQKLKVPVSKAA